MAKRKKSKTILAQLVDDYGKRDTLAKSLKREMTEIKEIFLEELKLRGIPSQEQLPIEGHLYDLLISKESTECTINDVKEVFDKLTREQFFDCCKIDVTALRKVSSERDFKALTTSSHGSRKVTVKPKALAAPKVNEVLSEASTKGGG